MTLFRKNAAANPEPPRLIASLKQLAMTALQMVHTRAALAGVELEEALAWLTGLLLNAAGLLVFALVGLLVVTFTVAMAVEPASRVTVLVIFSAIYLGLAALFCWRIQQALSLRPAFLRLTLAEMARDLEIMQAAAAEAPTDEGVEKRAEAEAHKDNTHG